MQLLTRVARTILFSPVLGLLALLATISVAGAQAAENAKPSLATEYRLTAGDKITVTVFGQAALSGDYVVDGSGNISMPLAGPIAVSDTTIKQCEQKIAARLGEGYIRQPSISVRISEPRAIYVVGDVKLPGAYSYRYGSTVLSAIAVAGGYARAGALPGVAAAEFLLVEGRVRLLEQTRETLVVRQARIAAQIKGEDRFDPPNLPNPVRQNDQLEAIIAGERQVLAGQVEALEKKIALQRLQKPTIEAAVAAVRKQTEGGKRQLSLINRRLAKYTKLYKVGLTTSLTTFVLQREKAALESSVAKLGADHARLELMTGEIDIKIQDLEIAFRRRALTEMQAVRAKLMETETNLTTARKLRELRSQQVAGKLATNAQGIARTMFILRMRNNVAKKMPARDETVLEPGDIVQVNRVRRRALAVGGLPRPFATGLNASSKAAVARYRAPSH